MTDFLAQWSEANRARAERIEAGLREGRRRTVQRGRVHLPGPHENRSIMIADDAMIQFGVVAVHREPDGRLFGESETATELTDTIHADLLAAVSAFVVGG